MRARELDGGHCSAKWTAERDPPLSPSFSHLQVEIQSRLSHPSIIRLYGAYETTDTLCLVLEFANGGTLYEEQYARGGKLPEKEAACIVQQVARCVCSRAASGASWAERRQSSPTPPAAGSSALAARLSTCIRSTSSTAT